MQRIFGNIGKKIKLIAKILFVVGLVVSALFFAFAVENFIDALTNYCCLEDRDLVTPVVTGIGGVCLILIISWAASLFIYAFGEIVEKLTEIEANTHNNLHKTEANDDKIDDRN